MSKLAKRYLILTFAMMSICWGACLLCSSLGIYLAEVPLLYIPYLLGGLSPTIASYLALKKAGKVASFRAWLKITFAFKHGIFSYLLLPILAAIFFFCLCCVSGYESGAPLFAIVFMIPMMLFGGGLEETGWRGILQQELENKHGYIPATILVAVIWWLWHLPLFYIAGVAQYGTDYFAFGINVLGLSFALAAVKKITGSTFLCVLFHCLINSLHGVFIVKESIVGNFVAAGVLIVFSGLLVWIDQKKHSAYRQ